MATFVQIAKSAIKQSVGGAAITTDAIDTTGADFLLAAVAANASPAMSMSDSKGNTWTPLTTGGSDGSNVRWFYCNNPTSVGSGHTITPSVAGFPSAQFFAYSGAKNATPLLIEGQGTGTSSSSPALAALIDATYDRSLIVSAICFNSAVTYSAISDSLTIENQAAWSSGNCMGLGTATRILGTGSVASTLTTWTGSGNTRYGISSAIFLSEDSVEIASAGVRVTQAVVETVSEGPSDVRVTQLATEVVSLPPTDVYVTQIVVETISVVPPLSASLNATLGAVTLAGAAGIGGTATLSANLSALTLSATAEVTDAISSFNAMLIMP